MIELYKADEKPTILKDYADRSEFKHDAQLGIFGWGLGCAVFWIFIGIAIGEIL